MTRVNTGIQWEYAIRDYFIAKGYTVVRAAGSKGAIDLVAFNAQEIIFIQAKKEKTNTNYVKDEDRLRAVQIPSEGKKQMWIKQGTSVTIVQLDPTGNKLQLIQVKDMKVKK